jgi:hypothetical protein
LSAEMLNNVPLEQGEQCYGHSVGLLLKIGDFFFLILTDDLCERRSATLCNIQTYGRKLLTSNVFLFEDTCTAVGC